MINIETNIIDNIHKPNANHVVPVTPIDVSAKAGVTKKFKTLPKRLTHKVHDIAVDKYGVPLK